MRDLRAATAGLKKIVSQNLFPYAPHLAFWQSIYTIEDYGAFFYSLGVGKTDLQLDLMEMFKANVIAGMPTYVKHISEKAAKRKIKSKVRVIFLGGGGAPKGLKERIRGNFAKVGPKPRIKMTYGSTESKFALFECDEGTGYHIHPTLHLWEVLDKKTLEPVGSGEPGLLVFSHLDFRGTVFMRYFTGDYVKGGIVHGSCSKCGSGVPRITGIIERLVDIDKDLRSSKVKGTLVNFNVFDEILSAIDGIEEYQVIITKKNELDPYSPDRIVVKLGLEEKVIEIDEKVSHIVDRFKSYTDLTPDIELESPKKIFDRVMQKMKGERIVDKRGEIK
jgi:phenylacetate-coenzyme A ligase PaaK-like adenylate-forming protein